MTRRAEIARQPCPESLWKVAFRRLDQLDSVAPLADLRVPPGNQLESLTGDRKGQVSIGINRHVPYQRINEIVNGRRGITPATALRLAKFFEVALE